MCNMTSDMVQIFFILKWPIINIQKKTRAFQEVDKNQRNEIVKLAIPKKFRFEEEIEIIFIEINNEE